MDKIITMDGPSGVGKGTASRWVAEALGWRYLDSGAIYRVAALACLRAGIEEQDVEGIVACCQNIDLHFDCRPEDDSPSIYYQGEDITQEVRTETCGNMASKISKIPEVRAALLSLQHDFSTEKGLVTDGRDMGTVVFPHAPLKIFLNADLDTRTRRRADQLRRMGVCVNIAELRQELHERDLRDQTRKASPLVPADDAWLIDTSALSVDKVRDLVLERARSVFGMS